jgi:hypothetical protein
MSAAAAAIEGRGEGYRESLTERMGRAPLPVEEALRYAVRIATCLRDLHRQRLVYGAVSSQSILLGPAGASFRNDGGRAKLGDRHPDVAGFGAVLGEMCRRVVGPEALRERLDALAMHCQEETADMQNVLIALRLLALLERQSAVVARRPVLRAKVARKWTLLANIAAFAMWGK